MLLPPACLPTPRNAALWRQLWPLLLDESDTTASRFMQASHQGLLDEALPEWQRLRGPTNTQHKTHDFTLDVHTAYVLAKTRESVYYPALGSRQKQLVVIAAWLHDIAKNTGTPEQRLELDPDFYHPVKALPIVRKRLPAWGFSQAEVELVCRVILHHQLFGRMIIRFNSPEAWPDEATINKAAHFLQSEAALDVLLALTEGDIRSVKANDALFTPLVAEKLQQYSLAVRGRIKQLSASVVPLKVVNLENLLKEETTWDWPVYCVHSSMVFPSESVWLTLPLTAELAQRPPCFCGFEVQEHETLHLLPLSLEAPHEPCLLLNVLSEFTLALLALQNEESKRLSERFALQHFSLINWQAMAVQAAKKALSLAKQTSVEQTVYTELKSLEVQQTQQANSLLVVNPLVQAIVVPSLADVPSVLEFAQQWQVPIIVL